jgi:nitrite reductase/ring-hydroxylating ferredoxin subunit
MKPVDRDRDTLTLAPDGRPAAEQPAWRQDFPVDWPQDQYVERRDFVKFLTLTSLAFTTGQFWIAGQSWLRRGGDGLAARRIAAVSEVPVGGSLVFNYPDAHDACVLVRMADAEFVAFSQKCTHLSCAVIPRPAEGVLVCPCHEGLFDLRTGRQLAGPPPRPLPKIQLEIRGDEIFATGVETRTI